MRPEQDGCRAYLTMRSVLAFSLLPFVAGQLPQCVMRESSTCACDLSFGLGYIDLSPLADNTGKPAFTINTQHHYDYWYNPCYTFNQDCSGDVAVCQNARTGINCGTQSSGTITVYQTTPTFGALISYTGGDDGRVTFIRLICDESKDKPDIVYDVENPSYHYHFNLTSKDCCPKRNPTAPSSSTPPGTRHKPEHHKLSLGTILDITFLLAVVTYLVPGILIMHFRRRATGKDLIPNLAFWASLPGLIKDGALFLFSVTRGVLRTKYGSGGVN